MIGRKVRARLMICVLGTVMLTCGTAGLIRVLFFGQPDDLEFLNVSLAAIIMGAMLIGQSVLAKYRVAVDEAYSLGHDIGIEEGFKQGRRVGRPVVVDLSYPKDEVQIRRHPE